MFQCNDQMTSNSCNSRTLKGNYLSNDLMKLNFGVLGYEPSGSKRVRIYEGDDSEGE